MMPWRTFLARVGVAALVGGGTLTLAVFAGMRLAAANPPGPTRDALTYAGVLRSPPSIATPLVFEFIRTGVTPATCSVTTTPVTFDPTGAFSVEVPITCPLGGGQAFFNGDPVTYTVHLGSASGDLLTPTPVPVTPVPYARFADQAGVNNDCPAGYALASDTAFTGDMRLCQRKRADGTTVYDDVVRVGTGAAAFWIDRYEALVTAGPEGQGPEFGGYTATDDYGDVFPDNGQWTTRRYAVSTALPSGRTPSRFITWFQADAACRASGKRLPTGSEWLAAARGTPDPGVSDGAGGRCRTMSDSPRAPGLASATGTTAGVRCVSAWGAEDMIGNLSEWTDEWYSGAGSALSFTTTPAINPTYVLNPTSASPWPSGFGDDLTRNVNSYVSNGPSNVSGIPAAATRGGAWDSGPGAGVFALFLFRGPSDAGATLGFRCVVPN